MSLNKFFDRIYCISLPQEVAPERWEACDKLFAHHNLQVERFPAIMVDQGINGLLRGEYGCLLSHVQCVLQAKQDNLSNVLILEDDLVLHDNFDEYFDKLIRQVPPQWDMLYFGGNHIRGYSMVSPNVIKLNGSYAIQMVGIKNTMFDKIIETVGDNPSKQIDVYYADMHPVHNVYCFKPHLAWQAAGHSYIQEGYVDYDFLKR